MRAYLGIGSNRGERTVHLKEAVNRLKHTDQIGVINISGVYETMPVGGHEQADFLNMAVEIETGLEAKELLYVCLAIEKDMGRVREVHWGPRIIDIDILFYGEMIISTPSMTIPHSLLHKRAFVLKPLTDIIPDFIHPVMGLTINELLERVGESGVKRTHFLNINL
ncbi:2-amino-4-hydroxy-6-hydroxymethyldihydropteridine diphosphokinase [Candidatus Latescibacterota bacterium]